MSYGLSSVVFGTALFAITGFVTSDVTISKKPALVVEVMNATGNRCYAAYGDETHEISFDATFNGGTEPTVGAVMTLNSVKYEVTAVDLKYSNKDVLKYSIKGKKSESVSLP